MEKMWSKYPLDKKFNYKDIEPYLKAKGQQMYYESGERIVERGDFPNYIYFIVEGVGLGQRDYADGSQFNYFQIDKENGSIGLLEILGRKNEYVASITSLSTVKVIRVEASIVYEIIMNHIDLLRKCLYLLADDLYKRSGNDGLYYYYSGTDRLRVWLVEYYRKHILNNQGIPVVVELSYEEIANEIGVSVRTVGRSISHMKKSEEVSIKGKKIIIHQKGLERINIELLKAES